MNYFKEIRLGAKVLVVDGDPQGNLSLFFQPGTVGGPDFGDLLQALDQKLTPEPSQFIQPGVRPGLDLIPARNRTLRSIVRDEQMDRISPAFSAWLHGLRQNYDWILIDSSPSNGALELMLIRASQAILIPLEFQLFSVAGLQAILEEITNCATEAGHAIRVHGLIFTKAENRLKRVDTYREVFSTFQIPIFEVCKSEYIPRSVERSRTIWEAAPESFAAKDYGNIIEKVFLE